MNESVYNTRYMDMYKAKGVSWSDNKNDNDI